MKLFKRRGFRGKKVKGYLVHVVANIIRKRMIHKEMER